VVPRIGHVDDPVAIDGNVPGLVELPWSGAIATKRRNGAVGLDVPDAVVQRVGQKHGTVGRKGYASHDSSWQRRLILQYQRTHPGAVRIRRLRCHRLAIDGSSVTGRHRPGPLGHFAPHVEPELLAVRPGSQRERVGRVFQGCIGRVVAVPDDVPQGCPHRRIAQRSHDPVQRQIVVVLNRPPKEQVVEVHIGIAEDLLHDAILGSPGDDDRARQQLVG